MKDYCAIGVSVYEDESIPILLVSPIRMLAPPVLLWSQTQEKLWIPREVTVVHSCYFFAGESTCDARVVSLKSLLQSASRCL